MAATVNFTGGTSVIRKLTLTNNFSQSDTSFVKITESATWGGSWTMSGIDFTFTTGGIPTWSAGSLTMTDGGVRMEFNPVLNATMSRPAIRPDRT